MGNYKGGNKRHYPPAHYRYVAKHKTVAFNLDLEKYEKLKDLAKKENKSISEYVRNVFFNEHGVGGKDEKDEEKKDEKSRIVPTDSIRLLTLTEEIESKNKDKKVPPDNIKLPEDVYELYNYLTKNEGLKVSFSEFLAESARTYARTKAGVRLAVLKTKNDEGAIETKYVVEKTEGEQESKSESNKEKDKEREKSKELVLAEAISGLNGAIFMYLFLLKENPKNNQIINAINDLLSSINKLVINYATLIRGAWKWKMK